MKIHFRAFHGPSDWGWVLQQIPRLIRVSDTCGIMAIDEETNTTVGAFIMDNILSNSLQCHFMITSPMVLKHGFIQECCDYVFNYQGMEYAYAYVAADNKKSIQICKRMGFKEKTRFDNGYSEGVDFVLFELKKADCKYCQMEAA